VLCTPNLLAAAMDREPPEPARTVGVLKQVDNCINLTLHLCCVHGYRKTFAYLLWSRLSPHLSALLHVSEPGMQFLNSPIYHRVVIEESLDTLAQVIDILQTIILNAPVRFPVALLVNDMGDLLELLTHSSTATHLQQQEDGMRGELNIWPVYLSSYRGQLLLDSSLVNLQAAVLTHQSLDLLPDVS